MSEGGPSGRSGHLGSFDIETSVRDARIVVPILLELMEPPRTVVDVGGGIGIWCRELGDRGVERAHCIDHPALATQLVIPREQFLAVDLGQGLPDPVRADLALCLETAEHLPEPRAEALVRFLTACADVVVFSAALPGQRGMGHLNEQPPRYWDGLFAAAGYHRCDVVRPRILANREVSYWYRQNMVLYASALGRKKVRPASGAYPPIPPDFLLVHETVMDALLQPPGPPTLPVVVRSALPALGAALAFRGRRLLDAARARWRRGGR